MSSGSNLWPPLSMLAAAFIAYRAYSNANRRVPAFEMKNPDFDEGSLQSQSFECDGCGWGLSETPAFRCPGYTESYCTQRCLEDMADHHLVSATFADMFPDDPQTNADYFFTHARRAHDKTYLLGLYIDIVKVFEVKPSTLHGWRLSGTMVENIKSLYEVENLCTVPLDMLTVVAQTRGANGAYYPWFLKHLELFEPHPSAVISLSSRRLCAACGVSASVQCSAYRKVWYCSKKCQENEWSGHLVECYPGRPITAADHLRAAAHRHKLPEDLEILLDYGFTRVGEVGAKFLLDVYGVVFEEGVRSRDLHQWNTSGKLLEEVEKVLRHLDSWKTSDLALV
ncbi:hypothetical protein C8R44DRAFT_891934 [Mycena epipterygia]|nr:hypothetical protein C8R44DRAFT_891934 [Mycena epipterygia]